MVKVNSFYWLKLGPKWQSGAKFKCCEKRVVFIYENFVMSPQRRQQKSLKDHFAIVTKKEEIVVKEPKVYPLFLSKKKAQKISKTTAPPKLKIETTSHSNSGNKENIDKQATLKKHVKRRILSTTDANHHLDTIIKADTQRFYATQKRNRTLGHNRQPLKKAYPHHLDLETIEKQMDTHYSQLWKKDPCCKTLFDNLSSIDRCNKRMLWRDRYRPNAIDGLVGYLPDYEYFRDWLNKLKIKDEKTSSTKERTKTKKKRKNDDGDDQENKEMLHRLMLLVGGNGLGKTATVYTAAKETGYSVFEINSASRRTGKDVTESVGEMTASHLVTFDSHHQLKKRKGDMIVLRDTVRPKKPKMVDIAQHFKRLLTVSESKQEPAKESEPEPEPEPEPVQLPQHHTLESFFKKAEEKNNRKKESETVNKQRKQSLILLEEVDILFEEDKGFWSAVIDLCQKSKRPIVMTCNGKVYYKYIFYMIINIFPYR